MPKAEKETHTHTVLNYILYIYSCLYAVYIFTSSNPIQLIHVSAPYSPIEQ